MRDETVSRSYAETLFEVARRHEGLDVYGEGLDTLARLLERNPVFRRFLETPRIADEEKKKVLRAAFGDAFPRPLVNFLLVSIDKRRQRLLRDIVREYHALLDEHLGRVHVEVTTARELADTSEEEIGRRLAELMGLEVVLHPRVRPAILGGIVVRAGDTIYDGSLRRRLESLRSHLNRAELPEPGELDISA